MYIIELNLKINFLVEIASKKTYIAYLNTLPNIIKLFLIWIEKFLDGKNLSQLRHEIEILKIFGFFISKQIAKVTDGKNIGDCWTKNQT